MQLLIIENSVTVHDFIVNIIKILLHWEKNAIESKAFLSKSMHSSNLNQSNFHWLNQWFSFSLIHQWKDFFFNEIISEIWLIYSNLFLAIWISQISLIISIFWLIQIKKVHHGFKSICYRISNIFIGSCSIFLWINSISIV